MFHKEIRATKNTHRELRDSQALGEVSTVSSQQTAVSFNSNHGDLRERNWAPADLATDTILDRNGLEIFRIIMPLCGYIVINRKDLH